MNRLPEDLDEEQRQAATAVSGPVCIVAGAGTGKTRTVTYRLAHAISSGVVTADRCLAITHSRKAAAELKDRLTRLEVAAVDARTFHAAGLRVASQFWARTGRAEPTPQVLSDGDSWRMWRDAVRAGAGHDPDNGEIRDVTDEVAWARSRLIAPDDYPAASLLADRNPGVDARTVTRCWDRYERAKTRAGRVDFADLLDISAGLLESDEDVAEQVRGRWWYVTVDEYQDTDPAQQRLLDAILGDRDEVCVVGDPRQAIYSWKGADPSYLTGFTQRYPNAAVFDLTRNYRSTPQILDWANRLAFRRGTKLLAATRPAGPAPKVTALDHEGGEAAWVAGAARRAMASGIPPAEIAVLYRFNATQARFEAAFARAGVPTVVADDTTFFDRAEVRAVLVPFGKAARAQPDADGLELLGGVLAQTGFDRDRPPEGLGAARSRWESHLALLQLVEDAPDVAGHRPDASTLLALVNRLATSTHGPQESGVTLATLHRAKGLEWDVVFGVGAHDGAIPSSFATTADQEAEEQRLLHVGVTRARRELHLTYATSNGRGWTNRPSPYLDLLPLGGSAAPAGRVPAGGSRAGRSKPGQTGKTTKSGSGRRRAGGVSSGREKDEAGASCPHCAEPLKGVAARRLGICADCVKDAPGLTGRLARELSVIVDGAARETGRSQDEMVGPAALMRLLYQRPSTTELVSGTAGVKLPESWAEAIAAAFRDKQDHVGQPTRPG